MNAASRTLERHRFDVHEYRRMGETGVLGPDARVELIDGEIIDMPPIGPSHNAAVDRLNRQLGAVVGERAILRVQGSFELSGHSEPEPDLALFAPRDDFYEHALPRPADVLLVIEIADSALVRDRDVKLPLYARHGVPEAWLVDLEGRRLTVHTDPTPDGYASVTAPPELRAVSPGRLRTSRWTCPGSADPPRPAVAGARAGPGQSRKFLNCSGRPRSPSFRTFIAACRSSRFLPVTRS